MQQMNGMDVCFSMWDLSENKMYDIIPTTVWPEPWMLQNDSFDIGYFRVAKGDGYYLDPVIVSIADVPNDQGGRVYISFEKSAYDTDGFDGRSTESYTVQRKDGDTWVSVASTGAYGSDNYYVVTVVDVHDNDSDPSAPVNLSVLSTGNGQLLPEVVALHQNYPNPFNPTTTLRYDLPEAAQVQIVVYDLMGHQIKSLVNSHQNAGFKSVVWDATNDMGQPVSAGMYIYRISSGSFHAAKKMILMK